MPIIPKSLEELSKKIRNCVRIFNLHKDWRKIDEFLEYMCRQFPRHESLTFIIPKVTAIDRLYRAMLYRQRVSYRKIAQWLMDSKFDNILSRLCKNLAFKNVNRVSKAVDFLAGLGDSDNPRYVVFASKYLHFHKRELFPIIDSFAEKKLDKLCQSLGLEFSEGKSQKRYGRYEHFCRRLLGLQDAIYKKTGYLGSWSDFDKYLYGERYLISQKYNYIKLLPE